MSPRPKVSDMIREEDNWQMGSDDNMQNHKSFDARGTTTEQLLDAAAGKRSELRDSALQADIHSMERVRIQGGKTYDVRARPPPFQK